MARYSKMKCHVCGQEISAAGGGHSHYMKHVREGVMEEKPGGGFRLTAKGLIQKGINRSQQELADLVKSEEWAVQAYNLLSNPLKRNNEQAIMTLIQAAPNRVASFRFVKRGVNG